MRRLIAAAAASLVVGPATRRARQRRLLPLHVWELAWIERTNHKAHGQFVIGELSCMYTREPKPGGAFYCDVEVTFSNATRACFAEIMGVNGRAFTIAGRLAVTEIPCAGAPTPGATPANA